MNTEIKIGEATMTETMIILSIFCAIINEAVAVFSPAMLWTKTLYAICALLWATSAGLLIGGRK